MEECTICFDIMKKKDRLTECFLCGKSVHAKCFTVWKKKSGMDDKCLYCQVENGLYTHKSFCEKWFHCCLQQ